MKKVVFMVFLAGTMLIGILSCSGKKEMQKEDNVNTVDSIAMAEKAELARLDSIRQDSIDNATAGLTFQTICHPEKVEGITLQTFYAPSQLEKNLKTLGFELTGSKKEYKLTPNEELVEVTTNTLSKTVGNRTTHVSFDDWGGGIGELDIYFPNEKDVEEFKSTVTGKLHDDRVHYFRLKITYSGTKVTIEAEAEP